MKRRNMTLSPFQLLILAISMLNNYIPCSSLSSPYFLSTTGDDSNDGTLTNPWKTLSGSITNIRKERGNMREPTDLTPVNLNILGGVYYQPATLQLDGRDSFLTLSAYNGESVIISGSIEPLKLGDFTNISNTTPTQYRKEFTGTCGDTFIGNHRMIPARSPNRANYAWDDSASNNVGLDPYHKITGLLDESDEGCTYPGKINEQICPEENKWGFKLNNSKLNITRQGDVVADGEWNIDFEKWSGYQLNETRVLIFHQWQAEYAKIQNITREGNDWKITFQNRMKLSSVGGWPKTGAWRFIWFNNIDFLDAPGEYICVQKNDGKSELTMIPPDAADITNTSPIFVSQPEILLSLNKSPYKPTNITIRGISFQHTSRKNPTRNYDPSAAISVKNAEHITIEKCEVAHTGNIGIHVLHSYNTNLLNNRLHDLGYYGISSNQKNNPKANENMTNLLIKGNLIDGCGYTNFITPYCIWVGGKQTINVISNDVINSALGSIMITGFNHGTDRTKEFVQFEVNFNRANNFGQGQLSDYAAIKTGVPSCPAKVTPYDDMNKQLQECSVYARVFNNLLLNGEAWHHGGIAYLYSDFCSCRTTFEQNILYGAVYLPLKHNCGLDNLSKNNIVHKTWPMDTSRNKLWTYCTLKNQKHKNATWEKNIFLFDDVDENFKVISPHFNMTNATFRDNIYWSRASEADKDIKMFPWIAYEGEVLKNPGGTQTWTFHEGDIISKKFTEWYNFIDWQASGRGNNSLWQDPMFEDPVGPNNYVFKNDSPAAGLGIQPVDTTFIKALDRSTKKHREQIKLTAGVLSKLFST